MLNHTVQQIAASLAERFRILESLLRQSPKEQTDPMTSANGHGRLVAPETVRFERLLPGPIDRVWAYVTDGEMRGKWLASGVWNLRVGGRVELNFMHADLSPIKEPPPPGFEQMAGGHSAVGEVLAIDPPRMVAITWEGGSNVTFELAERGDEVLLTLTHHKLASRAEMLNVAGGWHTHLGVLEDQAHERTPKPFWSAWLALKGEYESRLP